LSAISATDTRRRKKDSSSLPYKAIEKELKMQFPSDVAEMHAKDLISIPPLGGNFKWNNSLYRIHEC
jgi:hypothetical protein